MSRLAKWGGVALLVLGMGLLAFTVRSVSLDLHLVDEAHLARVRSVSGKSREYGFFDVQGERKRCLGGPWTLGDRVAYDPAAPEAHCRPEWSVGGFDATERFFLAIGGALVLLGILVWLFNRYLVSDPEFDQIEQHLLADARRRMDENDTARERVAATLEDDR